VQKSIDSNGIELKRSEHSPSLRDTSVEVRLGRALRRMRQIICIAAKDVVVLLIGEAGKENNVNSSDCSKARYSVLERAGTVPPNCDLSPRRHRLVNCRHARPN
jgi:hypothetical protein